MCYNISSVYKGKVPNYKRRDKNMNKKQKRDNKIYVKLVRSWRNSHKKKRKKLTDIDKRYKVYKYSAKSRGRDFELSIEQFEGYWQQPCYYCGDKIETIGLDRINNDKGYSIDNIVPCCYICNIMKRTMSKEEFIKHCKKIAQGH